MLECLVVITGGNCALAMSSLFSHPVVMLSAAVSFVIVLFVCFYFICVRVPALPGLIDLDDRNAVEKKRVYQLELQKQVCLCLFQVKICQ